MAGSMPVIFATGNHDMRTEFHREPARTGRYGTDPAGPPGRRAADHRAGLHHSRRRSRPVDGGSSGRPPAELATAGRGREHPRPAPCAAAAAVTAAELLRPRGVDPGGASAAIAGTDVRLILAGHHHLAQSAMLGSVPVAVAGFDGHPDRSAGPGRPRTDLRERRVQPGRGLPGHHHRLGDSGRRCRPGVRPGPGWLPGGDRRPPHRRAESRRRTATPSDRVPGVPTARGCTVCRPVTE